jgi:glycerophosphoryl diester phosphodiesterase
VLFYQAVELNVSGSFSIRAYVMKIVRTLLLLFIVSGSLAISSAEFPEKHYVSFATPEELQSYLRWTPERSPLISAHRGGPLPGYPENCIATFENTLSYAPCLIECDVRKSKDSVLVIMHDETLERKTTGKGKVSDYTLKELKKFNLKDDQGKITLFKIPTLAEVLEWARKKAIIELDIKLPVTPEEVIAIIREKHAENRAIIITYETQEAIYYHKLDPALVISSSAKGIEGVQRLLKSGIESRYLVAFVGVYEPPKGVYHLLHKHGIMAILGTMGNLDRKAERHGVQIYRQLLKNGADILATNNVPLAAEAIKK